MWNPETLLHPQSMEAQGESNRTGAEGAFPSLVQVLLRKEADDKAEVFARVQGGRH